MIYFNILLWIENRKVNHHLIMLSYPKPIKIFNKLKMNTTSNFMILKSFSLESYKLSKVSQACDNPFVK